MKNIVFVILSISILGCSDNQIKYACTKEATKLAESDREFNRLYSSCLRAHDIEAPKSSFRFKNPNRFDPNRFESK